jgi:hypothetical protein
MMNDNNDLEICRAQRDRATARADAALEVMRMYGGIRGDHHKAWTIDQAVRALTGDDYERWVADANAGEDGPHTYTWDTGIAP